MRPFVHHLQNDIRCNVTAAEREARDAGCVRCAYDSNLERACRLLSITCFAIAQLAEDETGTRIVMSDAPGRPAHALWLPQWIVDGLLNHRFSRLPPRMLPGATDTERTHLWVLAIKRVQGAEPGEIDAVEVLLALGEGLHLLG